MSRKIKIRERKTEIRQGFELTRIGNETTNSMTPDEQKRIHITPLRGGVRWSGTSIGWV